MRKNKWKIFFFTFQKLARHGFSHYNGKVFPPHYSETRILCSSKQRLICFLIGLCKYGGKLLLAIVLVFFHQTKVIISCSLGDWRMFRFLMYFFSMLTMIQFIMTDYDEKTKDKYIAKFLDFVNTLWNKNYRNSKNNKTSPNTNLKSNILNADVRKWCGDQLCCTWFTNTVASASFITFYGKGNDRSITIERATRAYIKTKGVTKTLLSLAVGKRRISTFDIVASDAVLPVLGTERVHPIAAIANVIGSLNGVAPRKMRKSPSCSYSSPRRKKRN